MERDQYIWRDWARNLQLWGVSAWAAAFLDAAGPFTILGAQLLYLSEPWLNWMVSEEKIASLARLLEDPTNKRMFIELLQEAKTV